MKKFQCLFLPFLLIICVFLFLFGGQKEKNDYYECVNHDVLNVNHLKKGEYSWSHFTDAQDKVDGKVQDIVQSILNGNQYHLDNKTINNIKVVYENTLHQAEQKGIGPLQRYIDDMMNCKDIAEFQEIGIKIENDLGVSIFSHMVIESDYLNHKKNIVYFYPITLAFGSNVDMFVNGDYMSYKAYVKRGINQLLKVYGYDKKSASNITNQLISFYEDIGKHSYNNKYLEDMGHYYHVMDLSSLNDLYSHIDISYYLNSRLGRDDAVYSVVDAEQIRFLNDYFIDEHLEIWKYYGLVQILSSYASYLGSDYKEVVTNLNKGLLGEMKEKTIEEEANDMVSSIFSSEIDNIFSEVVVHDEDKKSIEGLFLEIKDVYRDMLENNSWLSKDTKDKAVYKLSKMKIDIGSSVINGIGDNVTFSTDGLVSNIIDFRQIMWKKELDRLENGSVSKVISDTVVNACYKPQTNVVMVPSAFLYLNQDKDRYTLLGSIGMILAHEVTHGFDGNGSQFDENGNYVDWWNLQDKKYFKKLQNDVSQYYSNFEVLNGRTINGKKTVNENIADLGALSVIVRIAEKRDASSNEFKKMFMGFANLWASQEDEHYMKLLLLSDTHSPNKYRVNAVLSSTDKFYEVYHVHFWNDMYVSPNQRVKVW